MSPFTSFVSRKVLGAVAVFAVFAVSFGGYLLAQGSTATASGSTDLTSSQAAQVLDTALTDPGTVAAAGAPDPTGRAQLRADLLAALRLKGDARRSALADVRAKALAGGYGQAVQRRAERRDIRHDLLVSLLPDNLQQDLTALKNAPADQRAQLRSDIVAKALAGEYGPEVQKAAERLKGLRQG
jgi:hypothetical protein